MKTIYFRPVFSFDDMLSSWRKSVLLLGLDISFFGAVSTNFFPVFVTVVTMDGVRVARC